jgi:hypothetical protein
MVLLYTGAMEDPRVVRLDARAAMFWIGLISTCNELGRDTLGADEIEEVAAMRRATPDSTFSDQTIDELVTSELVELLPHGHVRVLARLDLWAFDGEAESAASVGTA